MHVMMHTECCWYVCLQADGEMGSAVIHIGDDMSMCYCSLHVNESCTLACNANLMFARVVNRY